MRNINGARVAVVGGAGFLGSHLVDYLCYDRECEVLVLDNLCVGRREWIAKKAKFVHCDITLSESALLLQFVKHKTQFVFNYAAWPYVPDSYSRPLRVCDVNFNGAMKVIHAAWEAGVEAILQVSSAEVYGNAKAFPKQEHQTWTGEIVESHPTEPHSSYGVSKAAIDAWVQCRWREANVPCIALRQFNCVGERESHPYVIPEIISQLSDLRNQTDPWNHNKGKNTAAIRLGNNSSRDFMYAGDAVRLAVSLLEKGDFGEVYNLGSESSIKIYDLTKKIGSIMGFKEVEVVEDELRKRPWEIWHLQSDNTKLKQAIGWNGKGTTSLDEALSKTIDWYVSNGKKWPWE